MGSQKAEELKQWCPPPKDWLNINVDATVDANKQMASLRVVIKDQEGVCKAAAVKTSKFLGSVAMPEAASIE